MHKSQAAVELIQEQSIRVHFELPAKLHQHQHCGKRRAKKQNNKQKAVDSEPLPLTLYHSYAAYLSRGCPGPAAPS